jgi:nitroreductase
MRFEEFMELARTRRSSKVLGLGEVPVEMVVRAVEAGVWAANAHNSQPWFFIVVVDHEVKKRLLDEMAEQWLEDLIGDGLYHGRTPSKWSRRGRREACGPRPS